MSISYESRLLIDIRPVFVLHYLWRNTVSGHSVVPKITPDTLMGIFDLFLGDFRNADEKSAKVCKPKERWAT